MTHHHDAEMRPATALAVAAAVMIVTVSLLYLSYGRAAVQPSDPCSFSVEGMTADQREICFGS